MDFFDECIIRLLKDGKPRDFRQILWEVDFSHNTLRQHLKGLVDQGLITETKMPSKGRGRPNFTYTIPQKLHNQATQLLSNPWDKMVTLPFQRIKHLCRFEKGGYCKKIKDSCSPQNCPQIPKQQ